MKTNVPMRGGLIVVTLLLAGVSAARAAQSSGETKRISDAAAVIRELRAAPDKGIPESIWDRAHCVVVLPGVKKAAFVFGGEHGTGVASCRTAGGWSAPIFMSLEKASIGAQIGAESSDIVLLVMNERGLDKLLQDKVTLGADLSLAAGPVGRNSEAATDAQLTAEMLSYSRAHGVFAGIDLSGGALRPDNKASAAFYGHNVSDREVLSGSEQPVTPSSARSLMAALNNGLSHKPAKHGA
jgi:lipid-binding SYLF domain-containing protein